jgi:prolyl-tRNA editing enzyme YbaK/EbsC (Cys-tRNA(Pro) deacylase)
MSLQSVREFFHSRDIQLPIIETEASTATVALAAEAHGVEPGRIAKTLAFRVADGKVILLVASGVARVDNRKFKETFGKGKMLGPGGGGADQPSGRRRVSIRLAAAAADLSGPFAE